MKDELNKLALSIVEELVDCGCADDEPVQQYIAWTENKLRPLLVELEDKDRQLKSSIRRESAARKGFDEQYQRADAAEAKLINRDKQPLGYIDPANLKTYRGVMAGGSWSPVQRTLSGLNLTLPIYLAAPPAAPDSVDVFADQVIGTKTKIIRMPAPLNVPQEGIRVYLNADELFMHLEKQGYIVEVSNE